MKIQYKAVSIMTLFGVVIVFLLSAGYGILSHDIIVDKEIENIERIAEEIASRIESHLQEKARIALTLSSAPLIKTALLKSNLEFAALPDEKRKQEIDMLNQKWKQTTEISDPFIQAYIANPLAEYFKHQQIIIPGEYGEIFLTDRYGALVASTGKLTTMAHAHKYWWLACYNGGLGRIFLDDRGFDSSVQGYVLGVVIPIMDENEIIGVLKCNVNIMGPLTDVIQRSDSHDSAIVKIVRTGGLIVSEYGAPPLSTRLNGALVECLRRKVSGITTLVEKDETQLVAFSPIQMTLGSGECGFGGSEASVDHTKGNKGEGWHIVVSLNEEEAIETAYDTTRIIIIVGTIFTFLAAFIALLLGKWVAKPIVELAATARVIGGGSLDARAEVTSEDEIGSLGKSLNRMAQNLKNTMTSRDHLASEIEQRKKTELILSISEKKFRGYIDNIVAGVVSHAPDTSILYCNQRALQMLGVTMEQMLEKKATNPAWTFVNEDGTEMSLDDYPITRALKYSEDLHNYMLGIVRPDRSYVTWIVCSSFAVRDATGKIDNILVTFIDITERVQLEAQQKKTQSRLVRAERLESLGVLAGGVAHDLNNSLGPLVALPRMILENIQGLNMEPNETLKEIEDCLSVIEGSALRSAEVVKDLLSLSRRGQYNLKPFDMNLIMCLQQTGGFPKHIRAVGLNVAFSSSLAAEPLMIMADRSHLERAVANLVQNAAEAILEEGRVSMRTFARQMDKEKVGYEVIPPGRYAVLEIADTGSGISDADIGHIFEPFLSKKDKTDQSGSGLGLAVVHGIVKDHDGFIDVASELHKGTTFTLYFPMISVPAETTGEDSEQAMKLQCSERILIVDDEKSQRFTLTMGLKKLGYDVSAATNGREAVALFSATEKVKKEAPFDIVVLDMTMEAGFDGLDTYEAILELYPSQKVIISSGHAAEGRIQTAITLGAEVLKKPYRIGDLAKAVRRLLDIGC